MDNSAQFDLGVGYLFERGKKRQHRLQAAQGSDGGDRWRQVADNERTLTFNVASAIHRARCWRKANLDLAEDDLDSFQQTVAHQPGIVPGRRHERRRPAEDQAAIAAIPDGRVSGASWRRCRRSPSLRQLLGYESVPENYDVMGDLEYQPVKLGEDDLKAHGASHSARTCARRNWA